MKPGWKILIIVLALLAGAFLLQTGIYVYKIKTGKISSSYNSHFTAAKQSYSPSKINAEEIMNSKSPWFGSANPELTVVEFGNFACNYSEEAAPVVRDIMIKYKNKIKFIYRDYPMDDIHPGSSELALAGKCAAEQNVPFWIMYDKMYSASKLDSLSRASQIIGLDKNKFSDCLAKQKYLPDLNRDLYDGYKNGVGGTPTFFFIKKGLESQPLKVQGAMPKEAFEQIITKLLKS